MKKINKLFFIVVMMIPVTIKAACTNQELARFKTLASNVDTYYEFDEITQQMNLTIYNLSNELRILINSKIYSTDQSPLGETKINNLSPGQTIKLYIYPKNGECKQYGLKTMYANLPYYNKYYNNEVCINNNHTLCSKWANTTSYTYEQFVEKIKRETQIEEQEKAPEAEMKKNGILDFLLDYYIIILLLIIGIGITLIYKLDKKSKFDF